MHKFHANPPQLQPHTVYYETRKSLYRKPTSIHITDIYISINIIDTYISAHITGILHITDICTCNRSIHLIRSFQSCCFFKLLVAFIKIRSYYFVHCLISQSIKHEIYRCHCIYTIGNSKLFKF